MPVVVGAKEVCVDSSGGEVRLDFGGGEWTYVQMIDFKLKQ